jgi:hypothetical protein
MIKSNLKKFVNFLKQIKDPKQVNGFHYKDYLIEPWLFIKLNNLNAFQAQVIKYAVRYRNKNNPIGDLDKIIDYCEKEKSFVNIESEK